jgi:hypothetical protein
MHRNIERACDALWTEHERVRAACMKVLTQKLMSAGRRLAFSAQLLRARPYLPFAPAPSSYITAHPIGWSLPATNAAYQEGLRRYPAYDPTPQQQWVFIQLSKREGTQHFLPTVIFRQTSMVPPKILHCCCRISERHGCRLRKSKDLLKSAFRETGHSATMNQTRATTQALPDLCGVPGPLQTLRRARLQNCLTE